MPKSTAKSDLAAIEKLMASRGWAILAAAIEADILNAAKTLGEDPRMTEAEMHYRRGKIAAADRMLTVPALLVSHLKTQALIDASHADDPPR